MIRRAPESAQLLNTKTGNRPQSFRQSKIRAVAHFLSVDDVDGFGNFVNRLSDVRGNNYRTSSRITVTDMQLFRSDSEIDSYDFNRHLEL